MYTCCIQSFKILASFCSWAGWFESYPVENPRSHIFAWCGSYRNWAVIGWVRFESWAETYILAPRRWVLQEELESVQKRAARFVTGNYSYETGSMTGILETVKMGVWNAIECWFLQRLVLGIRSSVGTLALPLRPLYSNISLLSFLLFLRDSHFNCPRMSAILPVS